MPSAVLSITITEIGTPQGPKYVQATLGLAEGDASLFALKDNELTIKAAQDTPVQISFQNKYVTNAVRGSELGFALKELRFLTPSTSATSLAPQFKWTCHNPLDYPQVPVAQPVPGYVVSLPPGSITTVDVNTLTRDVAAVSKFGYDILFLGTDGETYTLDPDIDNENKIRRA